MCPPDTSRRPSDRKVCPEQNTQVGTGAAVKAFVLGFQTYGSPTLPQLSTLPSCIRCRCTATMGQVNGALHLPVAAAPVTANDGPGPLSTHSVPSLESTCTNLPAT